MKQGLIILGPQGSGKTTIVNAFADLLTSAYGDRYSPKFFDSFEDFEESKKLPVTALIIVDGITDLPKLKILTETYKDYRFVFTSSTLKAQPFDITWLDHFQIVDLRNFFGTKFFGAESDLKNAYYTLHTGLVAPTDYIYRDVIKLLPSMLILEKEKIFQQDAGNGDAVEMVDDEIRDRTPIEDEICVGCGHKNESSDCQCGPGQRDRNERINLKTGQGSESENWRKKILDTYATGGKLSETVTPASDEVNHPSHYTDGGIEVIDFIEAKQLGYHLGNAVKYISRAGKKDEEKEITDLEKAQWFLSRKIDQLKSQENE